MFCGQLGGNREHVVGKWILNALDLYSAKTKLGFARETGQLNEVYEPCQLGGFVTDSICQNCNNGWMSRLESEVKPLLTRLSLLEGRFNFF
jgi:hypothetical protein